MRVNLNEVARLLRERGISARVDGTIDVATLYVGKPYRIGKDDRRYPVLVGPGKFIRNGVGVADLEDLCVGPDDDGIREPVDVRKRIERIHGNLTNLKVTVAEAVEAVVAGTYEDEMEHLRKYLRKR